MLAEDPRPARSFGTSRFTFETLWPSLTRSRRSDRTEELIQTLLKLRVASETRGYRDGAARVADDGAAVSLASGRTSRNPQHGLAKKKYQIDGYSPILRFLDTNMDGKRPEQKRGKLTTSAPHLLPAT